MGHHRNVHTWNHFSALPRRLKFHVRCATKAKQCSREENRTEEEGARNSGRGVPSNRHCGSSTNKLPLHAAVVDRPVPKYEFCGWKSKQKTKLKRGEKGTEGRSEERGDKIESVHCSDDLRGTSLPSPPIGIINLR